MAVVLITLGQGPRSRILKLTKQNSMNKIKHVAIAFFALALNPVFGQWTDQNSGISNDLNAVHFINNNEGWAVGRQGKIIHTTNAGATWTLQNSSTTNDLNKVYMVNSSCGYAVGDGGKCIKYNGSTWSNINISFSQDMYGVYFLDASTGWISGDWGRIMMTTDGGSSWTTQMDNSIYSNSFYDLHMLDAFDGWAVGSYGRVLHYDGSSWSNVSTPATSTDMHAVSFSSSTNGFMTGESSKIFYYDGSSWSEHSTSLPDNSYHVYGVWTVNNTLAYAAVTPGFGGQGYILKYDGMSWTTDYNYTGSGDELFYDICFPSAGKGYAIGAGGMIKTKGSSSTSGIQDISAGNMQLSAYPNPFSTNVSVTYEVEQAGDVRINVFDISGKQVSQVNLPRQQAGKNVYQLDALAWESGVYNVQVISGNTNGTLRLIK
jgi:photosystem II stability/assembly factor-like uncharacterized protein